MDYKQNKVVYLSHGDFKFHEQTRYSMLSLLDLMRREDYHNLDIVVYSNKPEYVPKHARVHVVPLDEVQLRRWRGLLNYVHRVKLKALCHANRNIGLPFIYVDGDTRWLELPRKPFEALATRHHSDQPAFYMHLCEGRISPEFFSPYFKLLQRSEARLARFGIDEPQSRKMWNSGVIGVPEGAHDFLDNALALNDELLPFVRFRNCIEQLALSLLATQSYRVSAFHRWLYHYWPLNNEAAILLSQHFGPETVHLPVDEQLHLYHSFPWDEAAMRDIQSSRAQRWADWRARVRNSMRKRATDLKALGLRRRYSKMRRR